MSKFAALGVVVGLWIANGFLIVVMDRWVNDIADTVITGSIRGVQVPLTYRRRVLHVNFVTTVGGYLAGEAALAIGWIVLGKNAGYEEVTLVAYLFAFLNGIGAVAWLFAFTPYFRHLAGILRDVERE